LVIGGTANRHNAVGELPGPYADAAEITNDKFSMTDSQLF
jgi:hypothetical protein